jgi:hypothetical protein
MSRAGGSAAEIGIMPGPSGGAADSLDEAKAAFRAAWDRDE